MVNEGASLEETRALYMLIASRRYGELVWSGKVVLIELMFAAEQ